MKTFLYFLFLFAIWLFAPELPDFIKSFLIYVWIAAVVFIALIAVGK